MGYIESVYKVSHFRGNLIFFNQEYIKIVSEIPIAHCIGSKDSLHASFILDAACSDHRSFGLTNKTNESSPTIGNDLLLSF
jgi:hypothetical protein